MFLTTISVGLLALGTAHAKKVDSPSSFPHNYSGIPKETYGSNWQNYFQVTKPLPNVTFDVGRQWAGNIAVDRPGFPNDTLFFWGFEKENGSLTAAAGERETEPWGIWLNGGPGSSSMIGALWENGPIHVSSNGSMYANNYSWHHIADYFWLDQPVGTGFSTASTQGYIADEDQMAKDFWGFVSNLVKVFPSLATRPLYLTGESYAGTYIPYIMKDYFSTPKPPVKLAKVAIGNGAMANTPEFEDASMMSVIETFPQLIGYDPDVYNYFAEQAHLCGFDLNLTYPQHGGHFPTLLDGWEDAADEEIARYERKSLKQTKTALRIATKTLGANHVKRGSGMNHLQGRANGTIDPWYRCALLDEVWDYAVNYTIPWKEGSPYDNVDPYDVPDALNPEAPGDPSIFLNNPKTVAALHAPKGLVWQEDADWVFQGQHGANNVTDPSVPPIAFFDNLATNASAHNISVVIYSGNDDSLVPHWSSEVVIQNTTFGGIQGFSRKPSTEWTTDDGKFAGVVHQERNWTYALVYGAGHLVPQYQPAAAFVLAREFIFGSNQTGLVTNASVPATGGENVNFTGTANDVVVAAPQIFVGSGSTTSTVVVPSASIAAWDSFLATRLSSASISSGGTPTESASLTTTSSSVGSSSSPSLTGKNGASMKAVSLSCFLIAVLAGIGSM